MTKISLTFFAIINTSSKRAGESRRHSCSIAADNNRAQAALHKGHLLRPREVTIDDRRRSSIKTQKQRYQSLGGRKKAKMLRSTR